MLIQEIMRNLTQISKKTTISKLKLDDIMTQAENRMDCFIKNVK